jgi:hypothetical protein
MVDVASVCAIVDVEKVLGIAEQGAALVKIRVEKGIGVTY